MAVRFDINKGFIIDSADTVREEVRQVWANAFKSALNTSPETPQGQLIDAQTAAVMNKDSEFLFLANQFNPDFATGIFQDALANLYFLTRKKASATIVTCVCSGLQGVIIPAGSLIKTTDGVKLKSAADAIIPAAGSVIVDFHATITGPVPVGTGTATVIVTQIPGWDSVINSQGGIIGRDEETQSEFAARIRKSVAANSAGSVSAIYSALANLPGVIACIVLENETDAPIEKSGITIPAHSICISIYGGEKSAIAETIYRKKDLGCGTAGNTSVSYTDNRGALFNYKIEIPERCSLGIRVTINNVAGMRADIKEAIKTAVLLNFKGEDGETPVAMGQTLYATRFIPAIISAGAKGVKSVEINTAGGYFPSASFNARQMPVLDIDNIEVVIVEAE